MNSIQALEHLKKGEVVVDEDYYGYKLIMGEVYKYRKSSGELISIKEFIHMNNYFSLPIDPPTVDLGEHIL